jgi:hypothetical protein
MSPKIKILFVNKQEMFEYKSVYKMKNLFSLEFGNFLKIYRVIASPDWYAILGKTYSQQQ